MVDADQPGHLQLQGFQDVVLAQACHVLAFNNAIAELAEKDNLSRFHLLNLKEAPDHHCFDVTSKVVGLETAPRLAGYPQGGTPLFATDLRALGFFIALHHGDKVRAAHIFDLLSAGCGTPNWAAAQRDQLPSAIATIVAFITGRNAEAVIAAVRKLLESDHANAGSVVPQRDWSFLIAAAVDADPRIKERIAVPRSGPYSTMR